MTCTGCGKDLPENAKFCLECGTKVVLPENTALACAANCAANCAACGVELAAGAKFCLECGTKCTAEAGQAALGQSGQQNMVLVCGNCGTKPDEGKKFCQKCGAKMAEAGVLKPAAEVEGTKTAEAEAAAPPSPAMALITSDANCWSYEAPDFFEALGLDCNDTENICQHTSDPPGEFSLIVQRNELNAETKTLDDFFQAMTSTYSASVSAKKKTEINGLPAISFQVLQGDYYSHLAILSYKQETWGFVYTLLISVPSADKKDYKESMDAFISSFKLDEEKLEEKYGERGEARFHAETVWQKNRAARKKPEAENPDCFFFDGSLISFSFSWTKTELIIGSTIVGTRNSLAETGATMVRSEGEPVFRAENYQFQSGPATVEVFRDGMSYIITVNIMGEIYPLGRYKEGLTKLKREIIDHPGRLSDLPVQSKQKPKPKTTAQPVPAPEPPKEKKL
ncbi:MAG: zinc ribbon domain-containing protein [Spirochaetes bacterium]|nr:zinc ribbon domain-containing protein [Spirochaetota bacterium]